MNDYNGTLNIMVGDSYARYAKIVGVDNGNPATTEKFQQSSVILSDSQAKIQMFNGKALVILQTTQEEGESIVVTAETADLQMPVILLLNPSVKKASNLPMSSMRLSDRTKINTLLLFMMSTKL